jgi:hypothetical protein
MANPEVTAGSPGSIVYTIGSAQTFTTFSSALSDALTNYPNLVAENKTLTFEMEAGSYTEGADIHINGFTTSATCTLTLCAVAGDEHNGVWDAGPVIDRYLRVSDDYITVQDIQIDSPGTEGFVIDNATNTVGQRLLIDVPNGSGSAEVTNLNNNVTNCYFRNLVVFCGSGRALDARGSGANIENCTFIGDDTSSFGALVNSSTSSFVNNVITGFSTCILDQGITGPFTNNACTSAHGQIQSISTATAFVNHTGDTTGDYTPASGGALEKAGTNPLSPLSNPDDWNDITGKTRAYWDIGAFAAPASLAENTHLATFTTRPTDTGASGGPNVAGTETNYPGYIDLSKAPQALWDAVTSGGGDIRVFENQAGGLVELPAEVVSCEATYQAFDGLNDYAKLANQITIGAGDGSTNIGDGIELVFSTPDASVSNYLIGTTTWNDVLSFNNTSVRLRLASGQEILPTDKIKSNTVHKLKIRKRAGSGGYTPWALYIDDGFIDVFYHANYTSGLDVQIFSGVSGGATVSALKIYSVKIFRADAVVHEYDARNISGNTWTDSVGSNDATLYGSPATPVEVNTGELHYLLPSISASTPQEIRLYADGVSSRYDHADPFGRNAVWGDYEAVYHMADDPSAGTMTDSAGNWDLTSRTTMAAGDSVAGQMGSAVQFNGSNEGFSTTSPSAGFLSTPVSFQVVAATNNVGADVAAFGFYEAASTGGGRGWIGTNGSQFRVLLNNDLKTGTPVNGDAFWLAGGTNNDTGPQSRFANLNGSDWVRDGVFADLNTKYAAGDAIAIAFMADATPAGYWNGWVDEARISNRPLSQLDHHRIQQPVRP